MKVDLKLTRPGLPLLIGVGSCVRLGLPPYTNRATKFVAGLRRVAFAKTATVDQRAETNSDASFCPDAVTSVPYSGSLFVEHRLCSTTSSALIFAVQPSSLEVYISLGDGLQVSQTRPRSAFSSF